MTQNKSNFWRMIFRKSDTQPSLFHYVKEKPDPGVFEGMDWSFLTHPIHALREGWSSPRTRPSLFHYLNEGQKTHVTFKELFSDIFTGFRNPLFIPSVFCDTEGLVLERARNRTRKLEASMVSVGIHVLVLSTLVMLVLWHRQSIPRIPDLVSVTPGILYDLPPLKVAISPANIGRGGGGGGGGTNELTPASHGGLAEGHPNQYVPPQLDAPKILLPADDLFARTPSIQTPFDTPQDPIDPGDITAPPSAIRSGGNGTGGGIGSGKGTGQGSGNGSGAGRGDGSGIGDGKGKTIGNHQGPGNELPKPISAGMIMPRALAQPLPPYTEEARKEHIEGVVVLQAVILRDGTVTNFKVVKGLGHGLDESAINTIASKWRFSPAMLEGNKVDVITNIEVRFRMF